MEDGEQNVGQLVTLTGQSQANVSKHLSTLVAAGMAGRRKQGLNVTSSPTRRFSSSATSCATSSKRSSPRRSRPFTEPQLSCAAGMTKAQGARLKE
ncbi:MAG: ArsR family transcriptional regulator [Verrucomicrobiota bacterium]|nr:ArsR family transcriptional regulator [Verrucomicrobiota bacterium]